MNLNLFSKPKEVQEIVIKNILAGVGGNIIFPLACFLMTDVSEKIPVYFYSFVTFTVFVSLTHFSLGLFLEETRRFFGDRN